MKIISISGLDGSGKSTQIELLKKHLESEGKSVFYFHAVTFSIAQKLNKQKKAGENAGVTKAGWLKIFMRKVAFLIDTQRFKLLKAKLERRNVDFLLTDRFFYDSLVNIAFLEGNINPSVLEKIMPRSDIAFYLQIEPSVILTRQRVPEQGIAYLETKKALFDTFAPKWDMEIIDGSKDQHAVHEEILRLTK